MHNKITGTQIIYLRQHVINQNALEKDLRKSRANFWINEETLEFTFTSISKLW